MDQFVTFWNGSIGQNHVALNFVSKKLAFAIALLLGIWGSARD